MVVFACFFAGCIACLSMSAAYHLISNHSLAVAAWANTLDYLGIVALIWGSFVPSIYYGFQGRAGLIWLYWSMVRTAPFFLPRKTNQQITAIALATGYTCVSPSFRRPEYRPLRAALFVAMGLSAIVPVLHGLLADGYARLRRTIALHWLVAQGVLYISGAALYAARVPERLWPGRFDLCGSSHQIFHVFVLAAAAVHLRGVVLAFHAKHTGPFAAFRLVTRRKAE